MTNDELLQQVHEEQIKQREQIKTLFSQQADIKELTETVHRLATSVELMVQTQETTNAKVASLVNDMDSIKEKPAKRWDTVISVIITAIITALVTYALSAID